MVRVIPADVQKQCEALLSTTIEAALSVRGGDINQARRLETPRGSFFLKMNAATFAHRMFAAEAQGLKQIAESRTLRTPEVLGFGSAGAGGWLLLEFIEQGRRRPDFWKNFGEELAHMHRSRNEHFGLDHDNFIGSLSQSNTRQKSWVEFYTAERLQPQVEMALQSNKFNTSDQRNFEQLYEKLPQLLPEESPVLIHGDLWSGNFLADEAGTPVLIDPAVCFASREMDIAMSLLFGGFDQAFYDAYQNTYPLLPGWEERVDLYQLYYLLVHVNLFGGGYVGSVQRIVRRFV